MSIKSEDSFPYITHGSSAPMSHGNYAGRNIISGSQNNTYYESYAPQYMSYAHHPFNMSQYPSNGAVDSLEVEVDRTEFDRYLSGPFTECVSRNVQQPIFNGGHYSSGFIMSPNANTFYAHQEYVPCPIQDQEPGYHHDVHNEARNRAYNQEHTPLYQASRNIELDYFQLDYMSSSDCRGEYRVNGNSIIRNDGDYQNGGGSSFGSEDSNSGQGGTLLSALADIRHMYEA